MEKRKNKKKTEQEGKGDRDDQDENEEEEEQEKQQEKKEGEAEEEVVRDGVRRLDVGPLPMPSFTCLLPFYPFFLSFFTPSAEIVP